MKSHDITDLGPRSATNSPASARRWRREAVALALAGTLQLLQLNRAHGENYAGYRFESYKEDGGRMQVETHAFSFQQGIRPWLELKGEAVYDCVSGATPTGEPPPSTLNYIPAWGSDPVPPQSTSLPLVHTHDIRCSGGLEPTFNLGAHHITPGLSYSEEHDYISRGVSLNYSLDLNEKNTTLNLGWSHNSDIVYADGRRQTINGHKDSDDVMLGVNQLLGPKTVLTLNFTYGNARGYLSDPYKVVAFTDTVLFGFPPANPGDPWGLMSGNAAEQRPRNRGRYIGYAALTQAVTPLDASIEGSYRLFVDSWGMTAHTFTATWFQKLGKHITVAPTCRYYRQSAADFYHVTMPGVAADAPPYFSADYRLSELESFAYGFSLNVKPADWLSIEFSYQRYEMFGLDSVTLAEAYPKANVVTIGVRLWF